MVGLVRVLIAAAAIHLAAGSLVGQDEVQTAAGAFPSGDETAAFPPNTTWAAEQRTIRYEYRLQNPTSKQVNDIDVYVPLPLESPRQKIHYQLLSDARPYRLITDRHGQKLAHYSIDLEPGEWLELGYVAGLTLKNMRWDASKPSPDGLIPLLASKARELYLKSETNYSMDSDVMRRAAASLVEDANSDFEKLVRIHDFVTSSIRYVRDGKWDPAHVVLSRGTGSCSEYNYVLSGLCRLAGLPTRCVGGSITGYHDLPTTDTVFHRWTEVYLSGYGWFPADCSRDANPIRGNRSHFGRVYTDAVVWCRQAGGEDDSLGWDYRAKAHFRGDDPGIRETHRNRWLEFHPEEDIKAARTWLLDGAGPIPQADLLECALLDWYKAGPQERLKMIDALAAAGRNECLRRAASLPQANGVRETCLRNLCSTSDLASTFLQESGDYQGFRNWFRDNEWSLVPDGGKRFDLAEPDKSRNTPTTTASSSQIWSDLVSEVVDRVRLAVLMASGDAVVIMPVTDQTSAGLGERRASILAALKARVAQECGTKMIDEIRFNEWMEQDGPGPGQYWILAHGELGPLPAEVAPDVVLVPVCITSRGEDSVLYHLELKALQMSNCKYTRAVARLRRKIEEQAATDRGILVAGGDTVLARWEHDLVARNGYDWPMAGLKDVLASADAALCNLECCVSLRGTPADKKEHCPFYYRARPEMLRCLTRAGIDIVTAANNHGGDYGPLSVADTARWCAEAGLVCVGNGNNLAEAETPRLANVGPIRVGFVGMDTTKGCFSATKDGAGINHASEDDDFKTFTEKVKRLGEWADGRCDLLVLTIHWGSNWVRETQPFQKKMARIAFDHGVDVVLGHSAHRLQGVEIVDGKPVVYDMGNLLFDCKLKPEGRQSALFRVHLSRGGVHKIEVLPVQALEGRTVLAGRDEAEATLSEMKELCAALGTNLTVDEDVEGRPKGIITISDPAVTTRRRPDATLACVSFPAMVKEIPAAIDEVVFDNEIPEDARKFDPPVELASNVKLLASLLPETAEEGGLLHLATWWRVTGPVGRHVMPAFHICPGGETPRRGTPWYTRHDAGDWAVPLSRLKPGTIVRDRYPARLAGLPTGKAKVYAAALDAAKPEGDRICGEPQLLGEVEIVPAKRGHN